ncbi:MAG: hypothetical protein DRG30_10210 [Epsilonproteobacteria bacterium]|nr:MAG: hypothetical protein DRG30_10210 [Campylobacterota bacterium]
MECNKLLRETLNAMKTAKPTGYVDKAGAGIDMNSKTMTALSKISEKMIGGMGLTGAMNDLTNAGEQ